MSTYKIIYKQEGHRPRNFKTYKTLKGAQFSIDYGSFSKIQSSITGIETVQIVEMNPARYNKLVASYKIERRVL